MIKYYHYLLLIFILFALNSCTKEENVKVLKTDYDATVQEPEYKGEDFIVNLSARALQPGERGEWTIVNGPIVETFVYFEDKTNPFTKFKGMPGEEYTLEWKRWTKDGNESTVQSKVKIPELTLEILDGTSAGFETIRFLYVNKNYNGSWTFDGVYARLEAANQSAQLYGYANTTYTATYKYTYGGKAYQAQKVIKTGNYTQVEGLAELQLSQGDYRVTTDNSGNVLELNLQASGIAWIFSKASTYPSLAAFTKLRKLILGGSSLTEIPQIFGDHYLDLEELTMDQMGYYSTFPENFGNLTKLKVLSYSPRNSATPYTVVTLPKSFANLKALQSLSITSAGFVDFNGTLGNLSSLKVLKTSVVTLTEDIGNLKELQHIELYVLNSSFPKRFSECSSLVFARLSFDGSTSGEVVLSPNMGDLKKLETFEITTNKLYALPASFSGLSALKSLTISGTGLRTIPENFGSLKNLEQLTLYGSFTEIPDSFGNLSKLSILALGGYAKSLPESFGNLSSLTYFNGDSSGFTTLPESFGNLKKLEEINMQNSKIETLPASFGGLDALEKLDLRSTQLKTFPKSIIPLKSIKTIVLNYTLVGDIPDDISKMKTGVFFYIYGVSNLTYVHLQHILSIVKGHIYLGDYGYSISTG